MSPTDNLTKTDLNVKTDIHPSESTTLKDSKTASDKPSSLLERRKQTRRNSEPLRIIPPANRREKVHSAPVKLATLRNVPGEYLQELLLLEIKESIKNNDIQKLNVLIGPDYRSIMQNNRGDKLTAEHRHWVFLKYAVILFDRLKDAAHDIIQNSNKSLTHLKKIYEQTINDATKYYSTIITSQTLYFNNQLIFIKHGDRNYQYILNKFQIEFDSFLNAFKPTSRKWENVEKYFIELTNQWLKSQKDFAKENTVWTDIDAKLQYDKKQFLDNQYTKIVDDWLKQVQLKIVLNKCKLPERSKNSDKYFAELIQCIKTQMGSIETNDICLEIEKKSNEDTENFLKQIDNLSKQTVKAGLTEFLLFADFSIDVGGRRKLRDLIMPLLTNVISHYLTDVQGNTLLDLAFAHGKKDVIHFFINRGFFHISSKTIAIGIDKLINLIEVKDVLTLLNNIPTITDFKKDILNLISRGIRNITFNAKMQSYCQRFFSMNSLTNHLYSRMPGLLLYKEEVSSLYINKMTKLTIYLLLSFHREDEEIVSKYVQTINRTTLPSNFYKNIKEYCHKLWEIPTYGIKSKFTFDDDRNVVIERLSHELSILQDKYEDTLDRKVSLEKDIQTLESNYKFNLTTKDIEITTLKQKLEKYKSFFSQRIIDNKKAYDELLANKERENVRLKSKYYSSHYRTSTPSLSTSPIVTPGSSPLIRNESATFELDDLQLINPIKNKILDSRPSTPYNLKTKNRSGFIGYTTDVHDVNKENSMFAYVSSILKKEKLNFPRCIDGRDGIPHRYEVNVPSDGTCLFYSVMFAYLIPVVNNQVQFKLRYEKLFGNKTSISADDNRALLRNYDGSLQFITDKATNLEMLVNIYFRKRIVDYMEKEKKNFIPLFPSEELFSAHIKTMADPFKKAWGDQPEISAISQLLEANVVVYEYDTNKYPILKKGGNHGEQYLSKCQLQLVFTSAANGGQNNHYHYLIDEQSWRLLNKTPVPTMTHQASARSIATEVAAASPTKLI